MSEYRSLQQQHGFSPDVYLLWLTASSTLAIGLSSPVITFTELIVKKSTFSIIGGVADLFKHQEYTLALVIFLFSVIFPIFKLIALVVLWFMPAKRSELTSWVHRLGVLGKWSMLDVYIVAMTVVIAKSSGLVKAEPKIGIYFFGCSVILSIFTSMRIESLSKNLLNKK